MIQYEKIELDYKLPIKLIDIYFEDHTTKQPKHYHNSIEIIVPILGNLSLFVNDTHYIINSGSLFIINSQEIHSMYHTDDSEIYKGYALQINYDYIKKYFPSIDNYKFIIHNERTQTSLLKDIYKIINAYETKSKFQRIEIESFVLHLLYNLLNNTLTKRNNLQTSDDKRIIQMTHYIDLHYNEDLSVESLANHFNMSPGYLSRYFKSNLNMTVKEYISLIRVNKAKKDVIFSDYNILDIAYIHGFPNLKSFINAFKKEYGDTPAKYRDKVRK